MACGGPVVAAGVQSYFRFRDIFLSRQAGPDGAHLTGGSFPSGPDELCGHNRSRCAQDHLQTRAILDTKQEEQSVEFYFDGKIIIY